MGDRQSCHVINNLKLHQDSECKILIIRLSHWVSSDYLNSDKMPVNECMHYYDTSDMNSNICCDTDNLTKCIILLYPIYL